MKTSAVIPAAGIPARMRELKPLLCFENSTIIRHSIHSLQSVGIRDIVVVTGYQGAVLERHLKSDGVMFIKNERYAETDMLSSVKLGLKSLPGRPRQIFVTPADTPLVSAEVLCRMMDEEGEAVCPEYQEKLGHPILLREAGMEKVLRWNGPGGIRGLLHSGLLTPALVPVNDPGVLIDIATPQDYQDLLRYETRLAGHDGLRMELQLNIGIDELFLNSESVKLLDMIDQTGSLQNACGCIHISYSKGWKTIKQMEKQLGFPVTQRRAGGVEGGMSSLTERGKELLQCYRDFHQLILEEAQILFDQCFPDYLKTAERGKRQ